MAFTIRPAVPADEPSLEVIRKQAAEDGFTGHYPRTAVADRVATADERLQAWITGGDTLVLVAETDVTPIGYGVLAVPTARILALYTAPEYQDEGCASALLARFAQEAAANGPSHLTATVPVNAVGFFERHGFERRDTLDRDGMVLVTLTKPLAQ